LSKETYVALGKAAAIVYKLGLHDTLRDLKRKKGSSSRSCMANIVVGIYASSVLKQWAGVCKLVQLYMQVLGVCVFTVRLFLPHVAEHENN